MKLNGNIYLSKIKYFDTIVVRRLDETTEDAINLREFQTWVNGVNIMINNGLTSYFAIWSNKETDTGFLLTYNSTFVYNNVIQSGSSQVKLILSPKQRAKPAASRTRTCTNAAVCIASGECPSRF